MQFTNYFVSRHPFEIHRVSKSGGLVETIPVSRDWEVLGEIFRAETTAVPGFEEISKFDPDDDWFMGEELPDITDPAVPFDSDFKVLEENQKPLKGYWRKPNNNGVNNIITFFICHWY